MVGGTRTCFQLVLTAIGREAEALELLRYVHFESAGGVERGQREGMRAFALHRLGRAEEWKVAAEAAVPLNPLMGVVLKTLGIPA